MSEGVSHTTLHTVTLFGIPNCDQVKKSRAWLSEHGIVHAFHDFKKVGLSQQLIAHWLTTCDWTTLLNRKSSTWRGLPDARRAAVTDVEQATALMLEAPSIVKRPILQLDSHTLIGFDAALYHNVFQSYFNLQTTKYGART